MVQWYYEDNLCKLEAMDVSYTPEQGFDPEEFKAKIMMEEWKGNAQVYDPIIIIIILLLIQCT